jgi:hypothetical protein
MRKFIYISILVVVAAIMFTLPVASFAGSNQRQAVSPAVRALQSQVRVLRGQMRTQQAAMRAMHSRVADLEAQATCFQNVTGVTGYYYPVTWEGYSYSLTAIDFTHAGSTPTYISVVDSSCVQGALSMFKVQSMRVQKAR